MLVFKGEGQSKCLEFALGTAARRRLTCIYGSITGAGKTPLSVGRNALGAESDARRGSVCPISVLTAA